MVETGGLENRCTGNRTGGSNPSPSASKSGLQRSCPAFCHEIPKTCPYFAMFRLQKGLERTECSASNGVYLLPFSGGQVRSPVQAGNLGECNAIPSSNSVMAT